SPWPRRSAFWRASAPRGRCCAAKSSRPFTDDVVRSRLADRAAVSGANNSCDRRRRDRKSTRLNSSHVAISYAVFCLIKKNEWLLLVINDESHGSDFDDRTPGCAYLGVRKSVRQHVMAPV